MGNEKTAQKKTKLLSKRSNNYMSLKHMRTLIILVVGLLVVGCGKPEQPVNTYENKKRVGFLSHRTEAKPVKEPMPTDQNTTKAKPVKEQARELTLEEKVVGTYEGKKDGFTFRVVLLENGIVEFYNNGEKEEDDGKWKIIDGELHANDGISVGVLRKNKDNSITYIARIKDGKREEVPKEYQVPLKKIK